MSIKKIFLSITIILTLFIVGCTAKYNNSLEIDKNEENTTIKVINQNMDEPIDKIKLQLEKMSLEEKIGQLVIVGMEGYDATDNIQHLIEDYHVGGIILYGKNVQDSNQLLFLINSLKNINSYNQIPLFISVDEEGGSVSRNPKEVKKLPAARKIGKSKDNGTAFEAGKLLGKTVKAFGYNMNFAPVLDINSNPLNPVIGNRSFGETAEIVSSRGLEVLKGIKSEGIIPVVKHFPGHGDTTVDSHIGLPVVDHDLERLRNFEIVPFKDAINNGADAVMVAHILLSRIDSQYPASMSHTVINNILREELEFQGVVITDDMTMGAIEKNYNIGDAAIRSINAGADIVLVGHDYEKALSVINRIKEEANKRNISIDRIDESVYRILELKSKYNISDLIIQDLNLKDINEGINKLF